MDRLRVREWRKEKAWLLLFFVLFLPFGVMLLMIYFIFLPVWTEEKGAPLCNPRVYRMSGLFGIIQKAIKQATCVGDDC